ncbi:Serine/arginine-rich splicing factor 12, partial [Dionaea muscipula]
ERGSPERSSERSAARISGGWLPVLNRRFRSGNTMSRERGSRLVSLFVEDIPDSMDYIEIKKMFAKFGVVRDVYVPKKRSKASKRFDFVRYDCSVATEVAIQRTNGVWIKDKELKVKLADFQKQKGGLWQRKDSNVMKVPAKVYAHNAQSVSTMVKKKQCRRYPQLWPEWRGIVQVLGGQHRRGRESPI